MIGVRPGDLVVDYKAGYREVRPLGWENPDCWVSDADDDDQTGLLPLKSEIDY